MLEKVLKEPTETVFRTLHFVLPTCDKRGRPYITNPGLPKVSKKDIVTVVEVTTLRRSENITGETIVGKGITTVRKVSHSTHYSEFPVTLGD